MKGQSTQEENRNVARTCRVKIRKAKAQPELNLATVVKDHKNKSYKYINNKKKAKENLQLLTDAVGNITTKDEEKTEIFNAFFASVSISHFSYLHSTQPFEVEDRNGEQNKPSITEEETATCYFS